MNLLDFKTRSSCQLQKSNASLAHVQNLAKTYLNNHGKDQLPEPEASALMFYFGNHVVAHISSQYHELEELPDEVLDLVTPYYDFLEKEFLRMFFYLLLICTRESRHNGKPKDAYPDHSLVFRDFRYHIQGSGSQGAVDEFLKYFFDESLGIAEYTSFITHAFYNGSYSSGYGGPAWGQVSDCLNNFVQGDYSAEMLLDSSFALCHNNGPIFNKGMLYSVYDKSSILRILDVQRAGQIPNLLTDCLVNGTTCLESYVSDTLRQYYKNVSLVYPDLVKDPVKYTTVAKLGAIGVYVSEIDQEINQNNKGSLKKEPGKIPTTGIGYPILPSVTLYPYDKVRQPSFVVGTEEPSSVESISNSNLTAAIFGDLL